MKITILGTGCIWTRRGVASYLIDDNILVDVGSGVLKKLLSTSNKILHHEKIEKIKLFLITHYHIDHYFDIVHFMWKIASDKNPNTSATIICPPGGEEKIKALCRLGMSESSYNKLNFDKYIKFVDASTIKDFKFGNYTINSKKMDHGDIDCYGYIIKEENGKTVAFSGDSVMCDSMQEMIDNSDFAFIDMAGTDISNKHFNIIDGIELMKEYKGKCTIIPCHLTSQAVDYSEGRINLPQDLMTIDTNGIGYDFILKKTRKDKGKTDFKFEKNKFSKICGSIVSLKIKSTSKSLSKYKMPSYVFEVCLNKTKEIIGALIYNVLPDNIEDFGDNITMEFLKDFDLKSVKYECLKLIRKVAKYHKAKVLYLTCGPNDFDTRKVYESLGAYLKKIKTSYSKEENDRRVLKETCIFVWEL